MIMHRVGAVILACVMIYFSFLAVNTLGLQDENATGQVVAKSYHEAGQTYTTDVVGGTRRVRQTSTPEMYILTLTVGGEQTTAAVDKDLYDTVQEGDQVKVVYQRRRLTGGTQVVSVSR
jgi:hypothetical protein